MELALGTLPLAPGYRTAIQSFSVSNAKTQSWNAEVGAKEKLDVKQKSVEVSRVQLTTADGGSTATLWIEASTPHRVLKSEVNVAMQMGVAKVTRLAEAVE